MTLFSRFRSVPLKHFLVSGAVWLVLLFAARGLWHAGCYTAGRVQQVLRLIAWAESLTDGDRANLPPFFDRRAKRTGPLEKWIRSHLPRRPREEAAAAAAAIRATADLLRSGDLHGERDAFAELTWRLETAVDHESWHPFLMELSARLDDELGGESAVPEELAGLLMRVAETIEPRTASEALATQIAAAEKEENEDGETNGETRRPQTGETGGEGESETENRTETGGKENGGQENAAFRRGACPGGTCRYGWPYYGF